jgi:predicted nucleic acid-binding protein
VARVLDTHALIVFFEKEPGFEKVELAFLNAVEKDDNLLMTSVNFGEVYYIVLRECGEKKANEIETVIRNLPIKIVDIDINLAREAARYKAFKKMSYADCFAAALAKLENGELLTGDKEFKEVENEVGILWIT